MGTPGRKPKPTHLKLLEGNPGKRKINKREPKPKPLAPSAPTWMSTEAKAEWKRVVPELEKLGLIGRIDRAALSAYCEMWATFVGAQRDIAKRGVVVTGYRRSLVKNPSLQIARETQAAIRAWCSEFGLTPSARTRLTTPGGDDDETDDLFDA